MNGRNDTAPNLPVVAGPLREEARPAGGIAGDGTLAAQILGAPGQRRGLRGGAPVLAEARSAYLNAQWSGPTDRRLQPGRLTAGRV